MISNTNGPDLAQCAVNHLYCLSELVYPGIEEGKFGSNKCRDPHKGVALGRQLCYIPVCLENLVECPSEIGLVGVHGVLDS